MSLMIIFYYIFRPHFQFDLTRCIVANILLWENWEGQKNNGFLPASSKTVTATSVATERH